MFLCFFRYMFEVKISLILAYLRETKNKKILSTKASASICKGQFKERSPYYKK